MTVGGTDRLRLRPGTPGGRVSPRATGVGAPRAPERAGRAAAAPRFEDLVERVRATDLVDRDEVAAYLEESGITDQLARGGYREPDVFALADRVHARLWVRPAGRRHAAPQVRWDWHGLRRPSLLFIRLVALAVLAGTGWWAGTVALLPALAGIPLAELLVAWHQGHVTWGLVSYDSALAWRRHLRALGWATLAMLVPPLVAGAALAGSAPLPASAAGAGSPALACGVLAAGGYALLLVLAARRRLVAGTALCAGCCLAGVLVHSGQVRVAVVVAGYLAGLVIAAQAVFDPDASPR